MKGKTIQWRTRKKGTPRQKGVRFPIISTKPKKKPKLLFKTLRKKSLTQKVTEELKAKGFKGWTIVVKYKDGTSEKIPVVAKTYEQALEKAKPKMNQVSNQIQELIIIDPSLKEILHKVGAGAVRVAKAIAEKGREAVKVLGEKVVKRVEPVEVKKETEKKEVLVDVRGDEPFETPSPFSKPGPFAKKLVKIQISPETQELPPSQEAPLKTPIEKTKRRTTVMIEEME